MRTAAGRTFPTMAMCGFRKSLRIGLRIATETGLRSRITVGPGSVTNPGVGRPITTGAGSGTEIHGRGGLARCGQVITRSGRRLTSRSGDGAGALGWGSDLDSEVGAASVGCLLVRATG